MDRNLFRKEAMEEVTSPDDLDQAIRIIPLKTHLLMMGIVLFALAGVLWGLYGEVPVTVHGRGIIMPDEGVKYILSYEAGIIRSVGVKPGQFISEGEVVGTLETDDESGRPKYIDIVAKANGRVIEVRALVGDYVHSEEKLISVIAETENQEMRKAIMFVPVEQGETLKRGLHVHINPISVNKEEYGYIKGIIDEVSDYPVSRQRMLALLGTETLVSHFADGQILLEVEVDLFLDEKTESGYQWSTPNGPPFEVHEGTLCDADFITEIKKPVQLVMPGF